MPSLATFLSIHCLDIPRILDSWQLSLYSDCDSCSSLDFCDPMTPFFPGSPPPAELSPSVNIPWQSDSLVLKDFCLAKGLQADGIWILKKNVIKVTTTTIVSTMIRTTQSWGVSHGANAEEDGVTSSSANPVLEFMGLDRRKTLRHPIGFH